MKTEMIPQNDTDLSKAFVRTQVTNLYRRQVNGIYFCCAKVHGRLIRKSLKTKSLEIARGRLADMLKEHREARHDRSVEVEKFKFAGLANAWSETIQTHPTLKEKSKEYRFATLAIIRKMWPGIDARRPVSITAGDCQEFAQALRKKYSGSRFNGCVETLRAIFQLGIEKGLLVTNPAMRVERVTVKRKPITLPSDADLKRVLKRLDANPMRSRAALVVRFLLYSGARPAAACQVRPRDVDMTRNEIILPAIKHQDQPLTVPMGKELRAVVSKLLAGHPGGDLPLLPVRNPRAALQAVSKELNIARLRPYDLRHLFTTLMLERGMPVPMVAALRGDKDGGAMLLKVYFHARKQAMAEAVKRVKW